MWLQLLNLLNPAGVIQGILDDRKNKRELKNVIKEKQIERAREGQLAEVQWNIKSVENSGWKDEWLTIILSIPLVLVFFPPLVPSVTAGFVALEGTPIWYRSAVGVMIASAFGYQKIAGALTSSKMNKAYTLPKDSG